MKTIYFDNAATSWPKPPGMIQAMIGFNEHVGANPGRSGHRLSVEAGRVIFDARDRIASLIGAEGPFTVVFARNATEAVNTLVRGMLSPGDHVVTSAMEHNSVMRPLREAERCGVELSVVHCSGEGAIDPDDAARAIRKNTRAIFVTHASNVTGTIMPVAELAALAQSRGIVTCVDAAQTAGCVPIDVQKAGIDVLFFTGHKSLYGPQGTGGMYMRKGLEAIVEPLLRGGTGSRSEHEEQPDFMPDRYESGTPNTIGIAGLGAGVKHVMDQGVENIRQKERALTGLFVEGLRALRGVRVLGPADPSRKTAVTSFLVEGMETSEVSFALDERFGIMTRPGLHCAPAAHRTIGTFPRGTVRCGFGIFTTEEEINAALEAIEILVRESMK